MPGSPGRTHRIRWCATCVVSYNLPPPELRVEQYWYYFVLLCPRTQDKETWSIKIFLTSWLIFCILLNIGKNEICIFRTGLFYFQLLKKINLYDKLYNLSSMHAREVKFRSIYLITLMLFWTSVYQTWLWIISEQCFNHRMLTPNFDEAYVGSEEPYSFPNISPCSHFFLTNLHIPL